MAVPTLPDIKLPMPMGKLPEFIEKNPNAAVTEIIDPYVKYEARLRQIYAQQPDHELVKDPHANVLSIFGPDVPIIKARPRQLDSESKEEKDKYIMTLPADRRRKAGDPAVVSSLKEFQDNLAVFCESSLVDLDWSNVVAAGSSVVNCLLPVPRNFNSSKRALREYYHEKFCPASDVDLFLYGLTDDEAVEKIKQIEASIRDSILTEVTTVRTKNAITICSQYPTRHVQIVLRSYKSVSEILTGFDIDCSGAAYDGKQVYLTPRALGSFVTQVNHIDLTRRSPSYENRLSKYSHRSFEVYWPDLERSRIDPTIFDRSFQRTVGLARLLVLEQLPTPHSREQYSDERRRERGRPVKYRPYSFRHGGLHGNIKDNHDDEVAEWITGDEISNYHTFTLPYGPKYGAKRIEKLCYTRDLLLNAEWNKPKDREVNLHRHPAFFGRIQDIIHDCCGNCPKPRTPEEKDVAEEEGKTYISGPMTFLKDDPGRQEIGSFNPLTDNDWTEMAYISNTARLCQAIVDGDLEAVDTWLSQAGADPDTRDYTGRTPLHLAVTSSTKEVVKSLVDHGARLVARLADGKTALHLAALRGDTEIVKIILDKSTANEEMEKEKKEKRRQSKLAKGADVEDKETTTEDEKKADTAEAKTDSDREDSDGELIDAEDSDSDDHSMATGSFVKVKESPKNDDGVPEDKKDEPDFYDIDVVAWDAPVSALHLAIVSGHVNVVKQLCDEYGANQILPIKKVNEHDQTPCKAILTLTLALTLPKKQAKEMAITLVSLGASCSQADMYSVTAFHRYVCFAPAELVENLWECDKIGAKAALNHLTIESRYAWGTPNTRSALVSAINTGDQKMILKLLEEGAEPQISYDSWLSAVKGSNPKILGNVEHNTKKYREGTRQPLLAAITSNHPSLAIELIKKGADVNTLDPGAYRVINDEWSRRYNTGRSLLDLVRSQVKKLKEWTGEAVPTPRPVKTSGKEEFLAKFSEGTYQHWMVSRSIKKALELEEKAAKDYEKKPVATSKQAGLKKKEIVIKESIAKLKEVEQFIVSKGGKTFAELYPDITCQVEDSRRPVNVLTAKPTAFKQNFTFDCKDLTETMKEGYIQLFEAAWTGDLAKIKSLTLKPWAIDEGKAKQRPLVISARDWCCNSPFSIAFARGHYDVARDILEIVQAQYAPKEEGEKRYTMDESSEGTTYSDESDSCASNDGGDEPKVSARTVNQKFTIENVGEVSMKTTSQVKPVTVLQWPFPLLELKDAQPDSQKQPTTGTTFLDGSVFAYAIKFNDAKALKFALDFALDFATRKLLGDDLEDGPARFNLALSDFTKAVESGHTELLAEIIKRTGAGMPLEQMVQRTGVEIRSKPRYYQGLTVYGKKRTDWADAGRGSRPQQTGTKVPPLLTAALAGSIESVEWFLSDTPARCYVEWGTSMAAANNASLKHLYHSNALESTVEKWLGLDNDQVLHCAVMAPRGDKTVQLVKYLIDKYPETIDAKTRHGHTPLSITFNTGRYELAKLLIDAGADQTVKINGGYNLVHILVQTGPPASQLRAFMMLLDPKLRGTMMTQRSALVVQGVTPLHHWINTVSKQSQSRYTYNVKYKTKASVLAALDVLLELKSPSGKEVKARSSAGDTIMHTAVNTCMRHLIRALAAYDPSLLYLEDAVGRTPLEVSRDMNLAAILERKDYGDQSSVGGGNHKDLSSRSPESFLDDAKKRGEMGGKYITPLTGAEMTWELVKELHGKNVAGATTPRRSLVGLNEANDVARRLGDQYVKARWPVITSKFGEDSENAGKEGDGDGEEEKKKVEEEKWKIYLVDSQVQSRAGQAWDEYKEDFVCDGCGEGHGKEVVPCAEGESEDEYDSDY